jgi:cytoplasmic iron level regulating protein YaaA (DUF328/UPF0246 family)
MRTSAGGAGKTTKPEFLAQATEIAKYMKTLSEKDIARVMKISPELSAKTKTLINAWTSAPAKQTAAIDSFLGDIYSGLQAHDLNARDRTFAQKHLRILSGLYGLLKPLDGIVPYRLEMAYKLPDEKFRNLYSFWADSLAASVRREDIVNLSSAEYGKAVLPHVGDVKVVTPKFLSVSAKTKEPTFVVVHAKIARGAFAHWLINERVQSFADLADFADLNYKYSKKLSSELEPVFVAKEFGGLGLSVRLT